MASSLIIKHALSLLNYLFVNTYLNQKEDLYICCHFWSELSVAKSAIIHGFFICMTLWYVSIRWGVESYELSFL